MVVGERGTGGSHAGGGGGCRVKEVNLDLELCGGYILSTLVVICVVRGAGGGALVVQRGEGRSCCLDLW